jgi:hypothetical protein
VRPITATERAAGTPPVCLLAATERHVGDRESRTFAIASKPPTTTGDARPNAGSEVGSKLHHQGLRSAGTAVRTLAQSATTL